jgi:hypothetical protein
MRNKRHYFSATKVRKKVALPGRLLPSISITPLGLSIMVLKALNNVELIVMPRKTLKTMK